MSYRWTKEDAGCYVDGTFGEDHLRDVLAGLLRVTGGADELASSLHSPDPEDDSGDDIIDALEHLQEHTEDGLSWILDNGDLFLLQDDEDEPGA